MNEFKVVAQRTVLAIAWSVALIANSAQAEDLLGQFGKLRRVNTVNAETDDGGPTLRSDGLELIFHSDRAGMDELYRSTRANHADEFGEPEAIGIAGSGPNLSADGLTLYFAARGEDAFGGFDLYQATRPSLESSWTSITNLGNAINTEFSDRNPSVSQDGLTMYFSSLRRDGLGGEDVYVATRQSVDSSFGDVRNLGDNINSRIGDRQPDISSDGQHLIFNHADNSFQLWIASRDDVSGEFSPAIPLDDFGLGSHTHLTTGAEFDAAISHDWPAPGSKLIFSRWESGSTDLWEATWGVLGDVDFDGLFTVDDVNQIMQRMGLNRDRFEIDRQEPISLSDVEVWVEDIVGTYFGDADLDGQFNSNDIVAVFTAGQYEDTVPKNSRWETGDWNGDLDFTSSDLVMAFKGGGYEQGPRAAPIPEPQFNELIIAGLLLFSAWHCRT